MYTHIAGPIAEKRKCSRCGFPCAFDVIEGGEFQSLYADPDKSFDPAAVVEGFTASMKRGDTPCKPKASA